MWAGVVRYEHCHVTSLLICLYVTDVATGKRQCVLVWCVVVWCRYLEFELTQTHGGGGEGGLVSIASVRDVLKGVEEVS